MILEVQSNQAERQTTRQEITKKKKMTDVMLYAACYKSQIYGNIDLIINSSIATCAKHDMLNSTLDALLSE